MGAGIAFTVIAILLAMLGLAAASSRRRPLMTRRALPLSPRRHRVPRVAGPPHFPPESGSSAAGHARRGFYSSRLAHRPRR